MSNRDKKWLRDRVRDLQALSGYTSGESVRRAALRSKSKPSEIFKLNANENLFVPKDTLNRFLREVVEEIDPRFYPQEEETELKQALGKHFRISPDCIMVGSGSDPLIALATQLFLEVGEDAFSISPTFSLYQLLVALRRARYISVPLTNDFSIDLEKILTGITSKARIFFLCSPNNPTANQFEMDAVQTLVEEFPGLVIIDEAYAEFAEYSAVRLVEKFENLVLVRTFSKAFGLAGLRLGYLISNLDLAKTLTTKAQLPYPVNSIALKMGLKLLANVEIVNEAAQKLKTERRRLIKELNEINGITAFDSQTNFILFKTDKRSDEVLQSLLNQGILVRKVGTSSQLERCLRVTIGLPEMNDKLLAALRQIFWG